MYSPIEPSFGEQLWFQIGKSGVLMCIPIVDRFHIFYQRQVMF